MACDSTGPTWPGADGGTPVFCDEGLRGLLLGTSCAPSCVSYSTGCHGQNGGWPGAEAASVDLKCKRRGDDF